MPTELKLTHAYVVRRSCGHPVALYVDDNSRDLGRDIARDIRTGRTIERMTIEAARAVGLVYCDCKLTPAEEKEKRKAKRDLERLRR